jgi:hypothetical protein
MVSTLMICPRFWLIRPHLTLQLNEDPPHGFPVLRKDA